MKTSKNQWFTCKVQVTKTVESGNEKELIESYLIDAVNFTDAETKIAEIMDGYIYDVKRISKSNYKGVVEHELYADKYYKVKTQVKETTDIGKDKITNIYFIAYADSLASAIGVVQREELKDYISDTEIVSAILTDIVDVITISED